MVAWMTSSENRALDAAMRQGYLVCRKDQRTLVDQYSLYCADLGLPVVRVERHGRQSQVVLQWPKNLPLFSHDQQCKLRGLITEPGQAGGLLPIVFRYGAYSALYAHEAAEELAALVASWIQEQF